MQSRVRVKICGITREQDARAAAAAGADAIGLVFWSHSPRAVDVERARAIVGATPPFVSIVGLFVDAGWQRVREVRAALRLDLVQYHGRETAQECEAAGAPYIRALHVREGCDLRDAARRYSGAQGLLLDTWNAERPGGSGVAFDWKMVPRDISRPLILAGGLRPDNVARAIAEVRPWAVDVSSGVESGPGRKDPAKIAAFIAEVERAGTIESRP